MKTHLLLLQEALEPICTRICFLLYERLFNDHEDENFLTTSRSNEGDVDHDVGLNSNNNYCHRGHMYIRLLAGDPLVGII